MSKILNVYALPRLVAPEDLAGGMVVVIDVLRASTTIVCALEAGAREVVACEEVDDARRMAREAGDSALLGGERNGLPIEGFDLGNSPDEYTPERLGGKTLFFTTTNGTRAMSHARQARRIVVGAFVNASAVARALVGQSEIHLLCAGTRGQIGDDDILMAGLLVDRIVRRGGVGYRQNAQAVTAREFWLHAFSLPKAIGAEPLEPERLAERLRRSPGGMNLLSIGLEQDILAAAQIDRFETVPEVDPVTLRIGRA